MNDRNGNSLAVGDRVTVGDGTLGAEVVAILHPIEALLRFDCGWEPWVAAEDILKPPTAPIAPPPPDLAGLAAAMEAKAVQAAQACTVTVNGGEVVLVDVARAYRECAAMVREAMAGKAGGV